VGVMFGWTLLLVIPDRAQSRRIAVALSRGFAGVMWPVFGSSLWFGAGGSGPCRASAPARSL